MEDAKPSEWTVLAFYPRLKLKVRITSYETRQEAYHYVNACIMCATPYLVLHEGEVVEWRGYELSGYEMAEMVERYT